MSSPADAPRAATREALEPRVIENPVSGERIVIHRSAADTGGELLAFDLLLPTGCHVPGAHIHPAQQERFTVVRGRMRFRLGRRTVIAGPGETVSIPPGTRHWFGNAGAGTAELRVEVRPAMRMQELFERSEAMGRAGGLFGTRLPRPADFAAFLLEFEAELAVVKAPALLLRLLLRPIARLAGRRPR
ncbi:MAG TPA: cupin domain-containing protein [Candidatus Dormibacteraeota bacterium]|jgi:quercetin dioxygenase-like cupin family protein|nr:cupin domain-containing protein [Candidatus Dormibacteraeota bacterium]